MKTVLKTRWLTAVTAALLVVTWSSAYASELRVGVDTAFVPFEFKGKDGKYTSLDVDLWDALTKRR